MVILALNTPRQPFEVLLSLCILQVCYKSQRRSHVIDLSFWRTVCISIYFHVFYVLLFCKYVLLFNCFLTFQHVHKTLPTAAEVRFCSSPDQPSRIQTFTKCTKQNAAAAEDFRQSTFENDTEVEVGLTNYKTDMLTFSKVHKTLQNSFFTLVEPSGCCNMCCVLDNWACLQGDHYLRLRPYRLYLFFLENMRNQLRPVHFNFL